METYCYPKVSWYVVADVDKQNKIIHAQSIVEPVHKSSTKEYHINDLICNKYQIIIDTEKHPAEEEKREVNQ